MEFENVERNRYGYYELKTQRSKEEEKTYFEKQYYQNCTGSYEASYDNDEIASFVNRCKRKEYILKKYLDYKKKYSLLDLGCGEGWTLAYFKEKGYDVTGIDYSSYAIQTFHPECKENLLQGDCDDILSDFIKEGRTFDVISSDMMLDMIDNPESILKKCVQVLSPNGVMWINVSNNYSMLQMKLLKERKIAKDYWLDLEAHPSYFNPDGLKNLCESVGLVRVGIYGESFIDFNLVNPDTNYYENPSVGKNCYKAQNYLNSWMMEISLEKVVEISRLLGEMGFGRTTTGVFKIKDKI